MSELSLLALILALILFISGAILFVRYFPWKIQKQKPLYMAVVVDSNDYKTYDAMIQIIKQYDLMDATYTENNDVIRINLGVAKEDYESIFKSLYSLSNLEVI